MADINKVLTVGELAEYLKVHPSTIYRLLKNGEIPAFKVGSDWRFNTESIDNWRFGQEPTRHLRPDQQVGKDHPKKHE